MKNSEGEIDNINLLKAAKEADLEAVKKLVNKNNANYIDPNTKRCLLFATIYGGNGTKKDEEKIYPIIEILLTNEADPNVATANQKYTPLHIAVTGNYPKITELLIKHKADIDLKTNTGNTALQIAISHLTGNSSYYKTIELLINAGADIDNLTQNQKNILLAHCIRANKDDLAIQILNNGAILPKNYQDYLKEITVLVDKGANTDNFTEDQKNTFLTYIIQIEKFNLTKKFFKNLDSLPEVYKNTLFSDSFEQGNLDLAMKLFNNGACLTDRNFKHYLNKIAVLVDKGLNIDNFTEDQKNTLLVYSFKKKNTNLSIKLLNKGAVLPQNYQDYLEEITVLVDKGANTDNFTEDQKNATISYITEKALTITNQYKTAISLSDFKTAIKIIEKGIIDVNTTSSRGLTILHKAAEEGNIKLVKFLVASGANIHLKDEDQSNALELALLAACKPRADQNQYVEVIKFLIESGTAVPKSPSIIKDFTDKPQIKKLIESGLLIDILKYDDPKEWMKELGITVQELTKLDIEFMYNHAVNSEYDQYKLNYLKNLLDNGSKSITLNDLVSNIQKILSYSDINEHHFEVASLGLSDNIENN